MMSRIATWSALLAGIATAASAQPVPTPTQLAAELGGAYSRFTRASPCFPREAGADDALRRGLWDARARLEGDQALIEAFQRGATLASTQQRHIGRSDPVVCNEVRSLLQYLSAQ